MSKARVWAETYASIKSTKPAPFVVDNAPYGKLHASVNDDGSSRVWTSNGPMGTDIWIKGSALLALAHWTLDTFGPHKETI